jgi:PAS domain S-box-containing protein
MSKINAFEQSSDGYLWLGTDGAALIRFDGKKFKEIQMDGSNGTFHYKDLVAKKDAIYFATSYSGFRKYSRTKKTVERLDNRDLKIGDGLKIIVQESCIYFIGTLAISRYRNGEEKIVKRFSKGLGNGVAQVIETPHGVFLTSDEGVFFFKDNEFKEIKNSPKTASIENYNQFQFGWYKSDRLTLYNSTFNQKIVFKFSKDGSIESVKQRAHQKFFQDDEYAVAADFHPSLDQRVILTNEGRIFTERLDTFERIAHNYLEPFQVPDGIVFGETTSQNFNIDVPLWNSKWFIVFIVIIVLLLNIFLLVYGRRYDSSQLLGTKDTELHIQMAPTTLLFGALISTITHLVGSYFDDSLGTNLGMIFLVGFVMFTLYIISLSAKKNGMQHIFKYLLTIGIYVIIFHFFGELYISNLHPFHLIGIVLTVSIAPFILNRIVNTVTFGIVVFMISLLCVFFIEDPVYSKINFMIAIVASIGLLIINTYLRYNSLEKLMFISGIINRGNFPVVAYSADGTITYVSENISQFADITHNDLIRNKISFLNTFVPFDDRYKEQDATVEFIEGSKYLIPMADADQNVRWMEWSYKRFSENTRVIIGQDVSERIELQNTYELLVQNVEDLIFTVDIDGNFVFLNDTFLSRTGYTKEELIGKNSMSVVSEECREEIAYFYRSHFLERKASSYKELPMITKSGETIWIGQYVNTIYTPGTTNHVKGFISLARDITDLRRQQKLMTAQRDDITASINYAQRIQFNLLPNQRMFEEHFEHYFIMFSPKDIVSGDFYWMQKIDNKLVLVLGDCTGHGVPGAFMTLLGINLLNNIVLEARLTEPGMILNELDKRLQEYFGATGKAKMTDGMELTICVMDDLKEEVSYACAGSRFLIKNDYGFTLYKGNNEHIGDQKSNNFKGYITQYTSIGADDTVYFFTDGFQDQFGGVKNKKYSFRRLLDLLESNVNLSLEDQRMMIEAEFDQWMSNQPQTDDVTIIGVQRRYKKHD